MEVELGRIRDDCRQDRLLVGLDAGRFVPAALGAGTGREVWTAGLLGNLRPTTAAGLARRGLVGAGAAAQTTTKGDPGTWHP